MSETENKEIPLCKNCKHINYTNLAANWKFWECHHPDNQYPTGVNPVNGDPKLRWKTAAACRNGMSYLDLHVCSPEGKWYEPSQHKLFLEQLGVKNEVGAQIPISKSRLDSLR